MAAQNFGGNNIANGIVNGIDKVLNVSVVPD